MFLHGHLGHLDCLHFGGGNPLCRIRTALIGLYLPGPRFAACYDSLTAAPDYTCGVILTMLGELPTSPKA